MARKGVPTTRYFPTSTMSLSISSSSTVGFDESFVMPQVSSRFAGPGTSRTYALPPGAVALGAGDSAQALAHMYSAVGRVMREENSWSPAQELDLWVNTYNSQKDQKELRHTILTALSVLACDSRDFGCTATGRAAQRLIAELEASCGWRSDGGRNPNPVLPFV